MPETTDELAGKLRDALANLDEYILRRAQELTEPLVDQMRAEAAERLRLAAHDYQRMEDLLEELRKRISALHRQASQLPAMRARATALQDLAMEILRHFTHDGHPGYAAKQTGWINVNTIDGWWKIIWGENHG